MTPEGETRVHLSRVWHIAAKELRQTRRDRLAALFTVFLPIVFTVFLGLIIGTAGGDGQIPLAVVDEDMTAASQEFVDRLAASPLLAVQTLTADQVDTAVEDQKVAAGLIVPEGFGAEVDGTADRGPDAEERPGTEERPAATLTLIRLETSTGAQSAAQVVREVMSEWNARLLAGRVAAEQVSAVSGATVEELSSPARSLVQTAMASPVVSVDTVNAAAGDRGSVQGAGGFVIASTGSLVQWVLFSLLTVAAGVAWERRRGLLRRLAAGGVSGRTIIEGKMAGMVIITFLQQLMLVLLGALAFGVGYFNSPAALIMTMVSLSLLAASVGLLISALFRSEPPVIATTVIAAQLLAVLGGAWFPLEVTSATFSRVAHFFPTAWIMDSLHGIVLKGWGAGDVLMPLAVVWLWIAAFFVLAVWRFRLE